MSDIVPAAGQDGGCLSAVGVHHLDGDICRCGLLARRPTAGQDGKRKPATLAAVIEAAAKLQDAGPVPVAARIASDVWSALRLDQDINRPLLAPPPVLSVPVQVVDDLPPGAWQLEMSDGTVRSSEDGP